MSVLVISFAHITRVIRNTPIYCAEIFINSKIYYLCVICGLTRNYVTTAIMFPSRVRFRACIMPCRSCMISQGNIQNMLPIMFRYDMLCGKLNTYLWPYGLKRTGALRIFFV